MTLPIPYKFSLIAMLTMGLSSALFAGDEKPQTVFSFAGNTRALIDTVLPPQNQQPAETNTDKAAGLIKEVPKSRKQVKPIAVTTNITAKPVIIKPKIVVKPIIKLH